MTTPCTDCKHFAWMTQADSPLSTKSTMTCTALRGHQHPVIGGDIDTIDACLMRMTMCGWSDPRYFEPRGK